jgi:hypothetical protein
MRFFISLLTGRYRWLWLTGSLSLAFLIFSLVMLHDNLAAMKGRMNVELADNPFRGLADAAMTSVQIQWGWAALVVGAGLLIAAAALRKPSVSAGAA